MATAEFVRDGSLSVTEIARPLAGDAIQGSTQEFSVTAESQRYPTPIFFAPQHQQDDLTLYWESLFRGVARSFYAMLTGISSTILNFSAGGNARAWDRLNLELMRIASLRENWDGEGAAAISYESAGSASTLLSLARAAPGKFDAITYAMPLLVPSVDGGITLKWVHNSKELHCTVDGNTAEVIRWSSLDAYESDGLWETPIHGVAEHFRWLFQ
jgi:hypothetical protein